ncbi:MAG TPA: response regulator transcription factor [Pyrinomonadaceae bacterium]|nr:response regulator transcription factor [Pyrinomonadaceae bacterium]
MAKQSPTTAPTVLRVLLAEDHEMVREGIKALVNAQPDMEVVGEASGGRLAVQLAQEVQPDVIVIDISMPELNGLKATERIRQVCPHVRVLTLTRHTDAGFIQQLFAAGASGYVLKQSASAELVRAIRAVAAGGNFLDPQITGKVIGGYISQQARVGDDAQGELSERESEVLRLIAWGHSNKEIAARLQISVKTVEAHKANTMKKLGLTSRIDIVRYALLQGWLEDT